MHTYRVQALVDPLRVLHDNMRCLALSTHPDSLVGWDMPIEKENLWIRQDVIPPNEENIERYVAQLNFTSHVATGLRDICKHNRAEYKAKEIKNIDSDKDVARIKVYLYKTLIYGGEYGPLIAATCLMGQVYSAGAKVQNLGATGHSQDPMGQNT